MLHSLRSNTTTNFRPAARAHSQRYHLLLLSIATIASMFCRSRHDVSPIKSRNFPSDHVTMYLRPSQEVSRQNVRSHDVFRTTYEMSDLIRVRIGSEGASDSSNVVNETTSIPFYWSGLCSRLWPAHRHPDTRNSAR